MTAPGRLAIVSFGLALVVVGLILGVVVERGISDLPAGYHYTPAVERVDLPCRCGERAP